MQIIEKDKENKLPKMPGLYLLTCKVNGKVYVGETLNLYDRISEHRCSENHEDNEQVIHLAIRKYGWRNFHVEVLVSFDPENITKEELIDIEERYIAKYDATNKEIGYNILKRGTSRKGYKTSDETKAKLSLANKDKRCGSKNPMFGKMVSEETKLKISLANKGRKHTEKTIVKMSGYNNPFYKKTGKDHPCWGKKKSQEAKEKSASFHRKPIYQLDLISGERIKLWPCAADAGKLFGTGGSHRKNINRALKCKQRSAYGFKWQYANPISADKIAIPLTESLESGPKI